MSYNWKHRYFENNSKELSTYIFRSLEIEHYLKKTLHDNGFSLQNYQINFLNSNLNILLSVCKLKRAPLDDKNQQKLSANKYEFIQKVTKNLRKDLLIESSNKKKCLNTVTMCKKYRHNLKNDEIELANLSNKMLESLKLFTQNKMNISLILKEINFVNSKSDAQQILKTLYKFQQTPFFKEGQKLLIPFITQNSAKLLGNYIAIQLRIVKKQHNFFFNFLKESLQILISQKFSKIEGIKILVKGRIKKSARSQTRIIKLGKISLISIKSKIDYAESTSFTSNGTLGVKVWISEKV